MRCSVGWLHRHRPEPRPNSPWPRCLPNATAENSRGYDRPPMVRRPFLYIRGRRRSVRRHPRTDSRRPTKDCAELLRDGDGKDGDVGDPQRQCRHWDHESPSAVRTRVDLHVAVFLAHHWCPTPRLGAANPPSSALLRNSPLHNDRFRYIVVISVAHPALPFQKRE